MAIGAILAAMLFFETAVMQTVQTNKKVPMASIKKADPMGAAAWAKRVLTEEA